MDSNSSGELVNAGRKDDSSKVRYTLLPPYALHETASALTFGGDKYGDENWRMVDGAEIRYTSAALRHINKWRMGEKLDGDSDLHHLSHAIASLMFVLELELLAEEDDAVRQMELPFNAALSAYVNAVASRVS